MTDYPNGSSHLTVNHFFDVTLKFPEFKSCIRYRRVGPCKGKIQAIRRVLDPNQSDFPREGWEHSGFTQLDITIRKVESFE